jgi:Na+-translocating ferredoxin:NAD+ oxidoreductase subunit E
MKKLGILINGILKENPVFTLLLGCCPTLAVTTEAKNGLGMGLATMAVLIGSNIAIASFKDIIPNKVRIPVFVVIIATFVTIVEMLMQAYFFQLYKVLGIFIPLIVVNCIILGRAEAFACKNSILDSIFDAIGMGLGFTASLMLIGSIREIIGNGTLFGIALFGKAYVPFIIMILPPGAFILLGIILAVIKKLRGARS